MRRRRNPEVVAGRIGAGNVILSGDGFSSVGANGVYIVTVQKEGFRLISAVGNSDGGIVLIDTWTAISCRFVLVGSIGGAAVNGNIWFQMIGSQQ